ncbi:hypothetical protein D3C72_1305300 [compost metagenome]
MAKTSVGPWGAGAAPVAIAIAVTPRMLTASAPGTRRTIRAVATTRPKSARSGPGAARWPSVTRVASLLTITPAFLSPMKAINYPMPAPIADRSTSGTPSTSRRLTPVTESSMKTSPEMKTAPRAVCHERPLPSTTE